MNSIEKNILLGVAVATGALTLRYGFVEQPLPFKVPGLDQINSKQLVAALSVVSIAVLVMI